MNSSNVIVHIGFHKTGTSAVQEFCASQIDRLLEAGIWYPQPICSFPGHQELAWVMMAEQPPWADTRYDPAEVKRHYADQLGLHAGARLLISSEEFCREPDRTASQLRDLFASAAVRILAYVREPLDFLISRYLHEVIYSESRPFAGFVRSEIETADFALRLAPWIEVFGRDQVDVRPYSRGILDEPGIVGDFLSIVGAEDIAETSDKQVVNAGVPAELGCLFAYLNRSPLHMEYRQQLKDLFLAASDSARAMARIPRLREYFEEELTRHELDVLARFRTDLAMQFGILF